MIASSTAEASSRTITISRVTFEEAFLRLGCSMRTSSRVSSAMTFATLQSPGWTRAGWRERAWRNW
jgi:hypothetical protein